MAKFLLSPTEHELIKKLGDDAIISPLPEEKGADVLIYSKNGLYGAQRKRLPHDFILSIQDGRMTRSTSLMIRELKFYEMICEGRFRYYPDGHLAVDRKNPSRFTRKQISGIIFDIKFVKGIPVEYTEDIDDTVQYLRWTYDRLNSSTHTGLLKRPSIQSVWYVPSIEEIHSWVLQSWPGIGPSTADAIISKFGKAPLRWTCTIDELSSISRLTKNKAREMIDSINNPPVLSIEKKPTKANTVIGQKAPVKAKELSSTSTPIHDEFNLLRNKLRRGGL